MHNPYFIPILPALAFATVLFLGARTPGRGAYIVIGSMVVSCLWSFVLLWWLYSGGEIPRGSFVWAVAGVPLEFGFAVDAGAACMLAMVSLVALLIIIYSQGYMRDDPLYSRFFAYLALFSAAMLTLVLTSNLILLFCSWELVGLMSYLLIGFWFERPQAARAAKKAFMTTRIGDVGFSLAIVLIFVVCKSLNLDVIFAEIPKQPPAIKFAIAILLFCGAVGKSAQFPLHVWLPDAMEGPTPVSALIHAATMVAAGVFLVWRTSPIFAATAGAGALDATVYVAGIGALTAVMAATIAVVQTDIKRVLAYSTISQLGYMMLGLGAGLYLGQFGGELFSGLFHLLTHAFFKALLFLAAGSVIIGTHHHQDIAQLGGLARKMPITCATFVVGALALCGVGIPGLGVGFSGFHSKDAILADALVAARHGLPAAFYWLGVLGAALTAFYMTRCVVLTFWTEPRDEHVFEHARETPPVMTVPLVILALFAVGAGWLGPQLEQFLVRQHGYGEVGAVAAAHAAHVAEVTAEAGKREHEQAHAQVGMVTSGLVVMSVALGLALYWRGRETAEALRKKPVLSAAYNILVHKYYQDEIWAAGIRALIRFAIWCATFDFWVIDLLVRGWGPVTVWVSRRTLRFDLKVIDDFLVHLGPRVAYCLGFVLTFLQTGSVQNYMLVAALGAVGFVGFLAITHLWPLWTAAAAGAATTVVGLALIRLAEALRERQRAGT